MENTKDFEELMKKVDSVDAEEQFKASIELARICGVPEKDILKSEKEIDSLFLD